MMNRLKASFVLTAIVAQLFTFTGCSKSGSPDLQAAKVTAWAAYQLPFIPIKFVWDNLGNFTIKAEATISTPIGNLSFGTGYTPNLTPERQWSEAATPAPIGNLDVIIRNNSKNEGRIYSIATNDQEFVAVINGKATLRIKNRQILIDISNGYATTDIADGQFNSLGILPAPVLGDFVLEETPVKQYPGSFPEKLSNCQNQFASLMSFPESSSDPFSVSAKGDVEWEIERTQSKGTGTYLNGGKLPIEVDLTETLNKYRTQASQVPYSKSIRWEIPIEANVESDYLLKWWEIWRQGHIDVFLLDRKIGRITVRYFVDIKYNYELTAKRPCSRTMYPVEIAPAVEPPRTSPQPPSRLTPVPVPVSALISAAQTGRKSEIELWLNRGAAVNGRNTSGRTALLAAVQNGHSDAAKFLLERGAEVDAHDNNGRTALIEAAAGGHDDTVRILLQWRPDVNAIDAASMTALREARRRHSSQIERMLERAGAWR